MYALQCSFSSVQSLSHVWLFATPWTAARQASLSITSSWSLPKLMSIESVMSSSHLILCRPLLLPSIFPSIRVFSNKSALHIRWPKYWSFSFKISPSNEYSGLISFQFSSVQLLSRVRLFVTPGTKQHARPPCPSPTPGVYPNLRPLSWWCHLTISSSVIPFCSCLQSFPTSGSFQMSQLFASGGQSIWVSASISVLPMTF